MSPDFKPYRVNVQFVKCAESPIRPLVHDLSFIKSKKRWGAAFKFGYLKIPANDFALVAKSMGATELADVR